MNNLVLAVKERVESLSEKFFQDHRLFSLSKSGELSDRVLAAHIYNVLYLIEFTPTHLKRSFEKAQKIGNPELIHFFREKIKEEDGHDNWARDDLKKFPPELFEGNPLRVSASMIEMKDYIESLIARDITLYVFYILVVEAVTILVGPRWVQTLTQNCRIPETNLSVIMKHLGPDEKHVAENYELLEKLMKSSVDLASGIEVIDSVFKFYHRILDEEVSYGQGRSADGSTSSTSRISETVSAP